MKKLIIIMLSIVIVLCIGLAVLNYLGKPVKVETEKEVNGLSDELSDVLYYASLAPNSHNAQMWKASINTKNNQVKIYLDEKRALKEVDSKDREAYISIGAYVTTLLEAFEAYGYETECEIAENEESSQLVTISYQKAKDKSKNNEILYAIETRHTDKSKYQERQIGEDVVQKLISDNDNLFYYKGNTKQSEYIKKSTLEATKLQAYNKEKAAELAKWLRLSDKETLKKKDGLPSEQLGITGIKKTIYYMITTHESAKEDSYAKQTVDTAKKQLGGFAGFLILTGENHRKGLIETGMNLQEVWINATKLGISVQPMSQILEESPYCDEINEKLAVNHPIQMVLRIGYVKEYGKNAGIRRDLSEYITVEE